MPPITYPPGLKKKKDRLFQAVYPIYFEMLEEHNRVADVAMSGVKSMSKWPAYSFRFKSLLKQLLAEQNNIKKGIWAENYTLEAWKLLDTFQVGLATAELYGKKHENKDKLKGVKSDALDELKAIDYDSLKPVAFGDPLERPNAYSIVDPNGRMSRTATRVTVAGMMLNETAYLYKDMGAGHFSRSYEHYLEVFGDTIAFDDICYFWGLANTLNDFRSIDIANGDFHGFYLGDLGAGYYIILAECVAGSLTNDGWLTPTQNTLYYVTMERDESVGADGTLYAYIYSNAGRSTLQDTLSIALNEKEDFRYFYMVSSNNASSATGDFDGYGQNYDIREAMDGRYMGSLTPQMVCSA